MSTERIFTQKVSMKCTYQQYKALLKEDLVKMGYYYIETSTSTDDYLSMRSVQINISPKFVSWSDEELFQIPCAHNFSQFNPDLFRALAAMSAGDQLYIGEPLKFTDFMLENFGDRNRIVFFDSIIGEAGAVSGNIKFLDPMAGDYFNCRPKSIRKATKEEVLDYYKEIDKVVDQVIEEVKESFETGAILGSPDKTNEPDFVTEYKEQSFFEENIAKELSGHTETNWVEEMEDGDNAEQILDQAKTFAYNMKLSKSLTDWTPQPFEPIWVWSNGETKRHRMLFAFFSEDGVFAFEEQFEKWSRFEVQEYKNFAKIDAPVIISQTFAKAIFGLEYGVPASLIQIEP